MASTDGYTEKDKLLGKEDISQHEVTKSWRHAIILPSMFFECFGFMLSLFVLNEWTQNQITLKYFPNSTGNFSTCDTPNKSDPTYIKYQKVQQESAKWQMIYSLSEMVPTLLVQLILPSYTDSYGRKFLFVVTMLGICLKTAVITLCVHFNASFWFILAGQIISGLTGSFFALLSAQFSFLADLTTGEKHRTAAIVVLEAVLMIGMVISSYFSGYFIETIQLGFFYTSLIGTCVVGIAFFLSLLIPESLPKHKRSPPKSIFGTVKRMTDFYISPEFKGQRKAYILLLLAFAMAITANINRGNMETLYFLGQPFCWGPSKIGTFSMVRNAAQSIVGLGSLRILQICMTDTAIAILSTFSNTVSYVIEGFATTTVMIYMVPLTGMFSFLVTPIIRGLMSSMTTADKQGAMFAGVATIEVISTVVGNLTQNTIYTFTMSFMNGFVFLILAVLSVINMMLMCIYKCTKENTISHEVIVTVNKDVYE